MKDSVLAFFRDAGIEINGEREWDIQVHDERFWRKLALFGNIGLGESYMDGWWDCEAIDKMIYRLMRCHSGDRQEPRWLEIYGVVRSCLFNLQKLSRAFQVGEHHYDIGNELYRRMLDDAMVYSCGYWQGGAENLNQAQQAKLELICQKLGLKPGMRVLDIGCGWGSFCRYAAENYDVETVGLTISREQVKLGNELCEGLPVQIHLEDYRNFEGKFDRIVSVGMFEHVGPKNYNEFMDTARRCLEPEGLFLLHTIGSNRTSGSGWSWYTKHIFPNGSLPSIAQIARSTEKRFIMEDLHNFGSDYDHTLMAWYQNFEEAWPELREMDSEKYDHRFYRMWRFYLLSCAGAFRARHIQLWQFMLSPEGIPGGYMRPQFDSAESSSYEHEGIGNS